MFQIESIKSFSVGACSATKANGGLDMIVFHLHAVGRTHAVLQAIGPKDKSRLPERTICANTTSP